MEELVNRIMTSAGVDENNANSAIAIILGFLNKEGPDDKMQMIFDALPGAKDLVDTHAATSGSGGLLGGLGNMMGGSMGAMAAFNELKSTGLDMDSIQSVVKELVSYAKEKAGDDVVNEVISKIPGLNQVI